MATTAYLDLFLRSVSEPALLQTLLSFVLLHQHEDVHILDTLVSRINTPFQVRAGISPLDVLCSTTGLINAPEALRNGEKHQQESWQEVGGLLPW